MALPSGYTQLEYIQSSGTQYIDTGVTGKTGIKASGKFALMAGGASIPLGCYSPQRCYMLSFNDSTVLRYGYVDWYTSSKTISVGAQYEFEVDFSAGQQSVKIDGVTAASSRNSTAFNNNHNIYAFAYNDGGTAGDFSKIRFYSLQLYDDDTLVRDYVPALRESDRVAGLYDLQNGVFYTNAGTGVFTYPGCGTPVGDHNALLGGTAYEITGGKTLIGGTAYSIAKGRTLVGGTGYDISFGLQPGPVNYVETTGSNYFDTGFYPAVQCYFRVVLDCEFVGGQPGSYPMAFGAWPSAGQSMFAWGVTSNMATWYMYNNRTTKTASVSASGRIILDANNQTGNWTINGATVASFGPQIVYTQRPIFLGAADSSGFVDFFSKIRIYSCQMSYATSASGGFTVGRNYIPHMDANGKGYLYDSVNGTALYPSGTGDALVG